MNKKRIKQYIFCAVIAIVGTIILQTVKAEKDSYFSYDQVINYIKSDEVVKVNATAGTNKIEIFLTDGTENKAIVPSLEEFSTLILEEIENGANIEFKL
ncbi:MAG: hypothetical protein HFJ28_03045 [Clostridia bacterium]|nr:hypothetical protein [Clostridia bacterium]